VQIDDRTGRGGFSVRGNRQSDMNWSANDHLADFLALTRTLATSNAASFNSSCNRRTYIIHRNRDRSSALTVNPARKNVRTSSTWYMATCLPTFFKLPPFFELPPFQALAADMEASRIRVCRSSCRSFSPAGPVSFAKPIWCVDVPWESLEVRIETVWRLAPVGPFRLGTTFQSSCG
jgi:hypothetical protein